VVENAVQGDSRELKLGWNVDFLLKDHPTADFMTVGFALWSCQRVASTEGLVDIQLFADPLLSNINGRE
jgi:hypothetical protein